MSESKLSMGEIAIIVQNIESKLDSKVADDDKRREVDDRRYNELINRTDKHGQRTTAVETQLAAFFSDQGAFKMVIKGIDALSVTVKEQGAKADKNSWLIAIGVGLLMATQFWLGHK